MSNQLAQLPLDVLVLSDAPITAQVSQLPVDVLVLSDVPIHAQLSQVAVEVLRSATPEVLVTERVQIMMVLPV